MAAAEQKMVCPECGEEAVHRPPLSAMPSQALGMERPEWSHPDGEPLCPVVGASGYEPALPVPAPRPAGSDRVYDGIFACDSCKGTGLNRSQDGSCQACGGTGEDPVNSRQYPNSPSPMTTGEAMTAVTGETTTHRAWLDWAETSLTGLADLNSQLDTWCAQITDDNGDQSQIDAIRRWQAEIGDVISEGRRMVDEVNATQMPVGEAVQAAGGSVNTPHKQYADEARTR
jgi:ribosomal protein L37AE/L43A